MPVRLRPRVQLSGQLKKAMLPRVIQPPRHTLPPPGSPPPDYASWTKDQLIERLRKLDGRRHPSPPPSRAPPKTFDFSKAPRRKIALKFCYVGSEYGGLVFQDADTALPTVEETLYNALAKTRLIDGGAGPKACEWERCGRTDRGVSSAGQVVSLYVRSALGSPPNLAPETDTEARTDAGGAIDAPADVPQEEEEEEEGAFGGLEGFESLDLEPESGPSASTCTAPPSKELRYVATLNRVLPPSLRVLAWSPVSPDFSARYSCRARHYKYFFHPHALDIEAMRRGAARVVGAHDFRNLSKLDPGKQLTNYTRAIARAEINPVEGTAMYVLDLVGNAFLYHQVRHIMGVLFLVGAGLEAPSIITDLTNADPSAPIRAYAPADPAPAVVTCKPVYEMADALPLVLWDCKYAEGDVRWQADGAPSDRATEQEDRWSSLYEQMQAIHQRAQIHGAIDKLFLDASAVYHRPSPNPFPLARPLAETPDALAGKGVFSIPTGGGTFRRTGKYVPVLERKRLEHVDIVNERWRQNKAGKADAGRLADDDGDE
ncbi:pseudouridine synthase [Amylostereum chailletii]|nr:pseudouridine synthase [Amylostereum chailletii]